MKLVNLAETDHVKIEFRPNNSHKEFQIMSQKDETFVIKKGGKIQKDAYYEEDILFFEVFKFLKDF